MPIGYAAAGSDDAAAAAFCQATQHAYGSAAASDWRSQQSECDDDSTAFPYGHAAGRSDTERQHAATNASAAAAATGFLFTLVFSIFMEYLEL